MSFAPDSTSSALEPIFTFLSYSFSTVENTFNAIPGSAVLVRYIKSSHQNDPFRTLLEIILVLFAIRTILQSRTRSDTSGKNFVKFTDKEIDELVDEWVPEPLVSPLEQADLAELESIPVISGAAGPRPKLLNTGKTVLNLASYNFTGLQGNEHIKERAIETLRKYGLGSCGPPGFYGTIDVHIALERDLASFLGTASAIIYSQGFSTISSAIPAFCKRGDLIIADRGVNFAIHRSIQISRSTVRWYDHNDLKSLEDVLESVKKEMKKKRMPLTRRFIVTEGIFENDGAMVDLPKLIELKTKYKYRLVLDESISFGTVGRTGRGLTELYNVPASQIELLVGSMANGLCSTGGFCAGSNVVVDHQRINGTSFVFSAAMPALSAVAASEAISILTSNPSLLTTLHENTFILRSVLDKVDGIIIPSHPASPIIHIYLKPTSAPTLSPTTALSLPLSRSSSSSGGHKSNPSSLIPTPPPLPIDTPYETAFLQEIIEECLSQGILLTRSKRLKEQEAIDWKPSIRIAVTSALGRKEVEKAAGVIKAAVGKVLGKRR